MLRKLRAGVLTIEATAPHLAFAPVTVTVDDGVAVMAPDIVTNGCGPAPRSPAPTPTPTRPPRFGGRC